MLSTTVDDHPSNWEKQLRPLCMAYNTSINPTTGFSPFFLMFGQQVNMPVDLMYGGPPTVEANKSTEQFANDAGESISKSVRTNGPHARPLTMTKDHMANYTKRVT